MDSETPKSWSFLSYRANLIHAIKSVINYTVTGWRLGSLLNCNTFLAVAFQWVWVVFMSLRRSSAWSLSTEDISASAIENKTNPSFLALSSVAWVCHQPDNSRTPPRRAPQRREHFPWIWPNPSDISPTKYVPIRYSPSVFTCAYPIQRCVHAHLTRCCKR